MKCSGRFEECGATSAEEYIDGDCSRCDEPGRCIGCGAPKEGERCEYCEDPMVEEELEQENVTASVVWSILWLGVIGLTIFVYVSNDINVVEALTWWWY